MSRQLVGDAKPKWQLDIDDLEHQKKHFEKELDDMLRSDDINLATDEDSHEEIREKIRGIEEKIEKIRADNKNKPDNATTEGNDIGDNDGDGADDMPEQEKVETEVLHFDINETIEGWREWKRQLPVEKYIFTKGFERQLGGNGALAHDAETTTEHVLKHSDIAHKTMQTVRKVSYIFAADSPSPPLVSLARRYHDACFVKFTLL